MTSALREAVFKAAENAGDGDIVSYLTKQANVNPASFMTLLGKLMPAQIGGDPDNPLAVQRLVSAHDISDRSARARGGVRGEATLHVNFEVRYFGDIA